MDRPTATAYLTEEFADLALETGWASGTLAFAYSVAIDQSLRQLGYAESDLASADVLQVQVVPYIALLDYFALKRYAKFFSLRVDTTVQGALSAKRQQTFASVKALLDMAERRCIQLGVGPVENIVAGRFTLDFLEPSPTEFGI